MLLCGTGGAIIGACIFLFRIIKAKELLIAYLDCESAGTTMECDILRSDFEDTVYPVQGMNDLGCIGAALTPFFCLIYIVSFQDIKKRLKACCSKPK